MKPVTHLIQAAAVAGGIIVVAGGLSYVALNWLADSQQYTPPSNPEELSRQATELLNAKCSVCHGVNAHENINPILNALSGGLELRDVTAAQHSFLTYRTPNRLDSVSLLKLGKVLKNRTMPPTAYTMVHWGSRLNAAEEKLLSAYVDENTTLKHLRFKPLHEQCPEEANPLKTYLGHLLFFDTRLSIDNTLSCASCHDLTKGGTDNKPFSEGVKKDGKPQFGGVNAPTVFNAANNFIQFWDGRAANLQEQAGGPPLNPVEMGFAKPEDWKIISNRLAEDPRMADLFRQVYGDRGINSDTITDAIAAFECTLITVDSPFDRYLKGEKTALSQQQIDGMNDFVDFGCATCHSGPNLGGSSFEYISNRCDFRSGREPGSARGRYDFSKKECDIDHFKVPTLRNVALTAPYFHDSSAPTLKDAVERMIATQSDKTATPKQVDDIVAFLEAQTGTYKGVPVDKLTPDMVAPAPEPPAVPAPAEPQASAANGVHYIAI